MFYSTQQRLHIQNAALNISHLQNCMKNSYRIQRIFYSNIRNKMDCKKLFAQSKFVSDPRIVAARKAISKRFKLMGLFGIFSIILIYFCFTFITSITDAVGIYNMTKGKQESFVPKMNTRVIISNKEFDNETYKKDGDVELVDEYKEFNRTMLSIKQTYSDFNQKVSDYQRALNKEVTDKVDETMMLREHDNY